MNTPTGDNKASDNRTAPSGDLSAPIPHVLASGDNKAETSYGAPEGTSHFKADKPGERDGNYGGEMYRD